MKDATDYPTVAFAAQQDWESWLEENHEQEQGVWIKFAKKATGIPSITYAEALDVALCYGWIDGQTNSLDEQYWLQKFTPRRAKSIWSKVNREKVAVLQAAGKMKPAGIKQVEAAQADGRWDAAYDGPSKTTVPEDFQSELEKNPQALAFFNTLNKTNRYAILFQIHTAKRTATRAARIQKYVTMLAKNEKLY